LTDVCVAIDANEALDTKNQHFQEWIAECGLISAHENLNDEEYYKNHKIPTTHQHSTTKIDHVLCTPRLFGCVTGTAIEPLHNGSFQIIALSFSISTPILCLVKQSTLPNQKQGCWHLRGKNQFTSIALS
jgi:hypothetical protein